MIELQQATASPDPWLPRPWEVVSTRRETWDTRTITIRPQEGGPLGLDRAGGPLGPRPGQFGMLYAFGVGEVAISFSSIDDDTVSHTIRSVGKVSGALSRLGPGAMVGVRGPFGTGWDADEHSGREIVIVAGGVGLAPLKPLIDQLRRNPERYSRVHVLYGARDPDNIIFSGEIDDWSRAFDFQVTVDSADAGWHGKVGVVISLLDRIEMDPANVTAFICGPEIMMRFTVERLTSLGVDEQQIFLSMERNMKCAVGFCGHCQFGPSFICRDGPVFPYGSVARELRIAEL